MHRVPGWAGALILLAIAHSFPFQVGGQELPGSAPAAAAPNAAATAQGPGTLVPNNASALGGAGGLNASSLNATDPLYNASLVIANHTRNCPIPIVNYTDEQFTTNRLVEIFTPLVLSGPRTNCSQRAQSMAVCAFDGTMKMESGCCSRVCANTMRPLQELGCVDEMLMGLCNSTGTQLTDIYSIVPPLINGYRRCVGSRAPSNIICPDGRMLPIPWTFEELNATVNGTAINTTDALGSDEATPVAPGAAGPLPGAVPLASSDEINQVATAPGTEPTTAPIEEPAAAPAGANEPGPAPPGGAQEP